MRNLFMLVLIIITVNVHAQTHLFGVKGGVNFTDVTANNFVNDRNFRTGLTFGLTYDYNFEKNLSTGADFLYSQRGFTTDIIYTDETGTPTGFMATLKYNYDYISLPIKVGFNYGRNFYGFSNIGLTPSILVDAKTVTPTIVYNGAITYGESFSTTRDVDRFDIGGFLEIGGGYKVKERYWLFSSFSYLHSFTAFTNSNYFADNEIRHYGMALNVGLKLKLTD